MRSALLVAAFVSLSATAAAAAPLRCQKGLASAPFIGAADMRTIDRGAARLPAERPGFVHLSVGSPVARNVTRKPLPASVAKVLPQYRSGGYTAFRVGERLAILDRHGVLVYILPIGRPTRPGNCP